MGIGGGSALDMAKIVKTRLRTGREVADFVMQRNPLPPMEAQVPSVMIPTQPPAQVQNRRVRIFLLWKMVIRVGYGGLKRARIWRCSTRILAPLCLARLTAWTGIDALIHAFEAATNRYTHKGAQLYAYEAIRLSVAALPDAVTQWIICPPEQICCLPAIMPDVRLIFVLPYCPCAQPCAGTPCPYTSRAGDGSWV